nr:TetR family transcriptional regulator [Duganella guangzhouensis]
MGQVDNCCGGRGKALQSGGINAEVVHVRSKSGKPEYGEGRQALIEAAIRLVAREGLVKLTYRSLAAEANMTAGALQHHFSAIDQVLDEALEYCLEQSTRYSRAIHSLSDFIDVVVSFTRAEPALQIFQVELFAAARLRPSLAILVERHQESYRELVRDMLTDLNIAHDDSLVEFITAAIDGIVFQVVMQNDERQRQRMDLQFDTLKRVIAGYPAIA